MLTTTIEYSLRTRPFQAMLLSNMAVNFVLNAVFQWGSASKWGGRVFEEWPTISAVEMGDDLAVMALLLGTLCSLFASMDMEKGVEDGRFRPFRASEVASAWWRTWTPAGIASTWLRSVLMGCSVFAIVGIPLAAAPRLMGWQLAAPAWVFIAAKGMVAALLTPLVILFNFLAVLSTRARDKTQ